MRFMIIVKATRDSEAGKLPDEKMLAEMTKFNEELTKAGVMLAGEGLQASSKGARVRFSGSKRAVVEREVELLAGVGLVVGVAALAACGTKKETITTVSTLTVERRTIVVDAQATGAVEPINVIEVKSKEEAIEWVKRCPNPHPGAESEIEIRQVFEAEDFGEAFTPELRQAEERIRAQAAART